MPGRHARPPSRVARVVRSAVPLAAVAGTFGTFAAASAAHAPAASQPEWWLPDVPHVDEMHARLMAKQHTPQRHYTVQEGDTLTAIAQRYYGTPLAWHRIWQANQDVIAHPHWIFPGQRLVIPHGHYTPPPVPPPAPHVHHVHHHAAAQTSAVQQGGWPGGAFGACVVERESSGNPQVMNSSGHYGLYQFSASTWARYGGNPADFGHASVAEQERVFMNALAQGGEFNWAPYDGC